MHKWLLILALAGLAGCSLTTPENQVNNPVFQLPVDPIAYIQNDQVWLASSDGTSQTQITSDSFSHFSPVWFPNTTSLLYGVDSGDYYELWMYDVTQGQSKFILASKQQPQEISIAPNSKYLLYFEGDNLYLFDIESTSGIRLHEGAIDATWSPDSKSILFTTNDQRVLLQDFSIKSELTDPKVVLEEEIRKPQFVDQNTIVYEARINEDGINNEVTLKEFDLVTLESKPISSLRFSEFGATDIIIEPDGKRALYIRPDDVTLLANIWLVHLSKDLPKLILTNVQTPIWSQLSDTIIYVDSAVKENDTVVPVIYTATTSGLNKTSVIENAHSVVSGANSQSNALK